MHKRIVFGIILLSMGLGTAQQPYRVGTTAANFLEIGYGAAGNAMGDAYVSLASDLSAAYWNPAGLAQLPRPDALFFYQPWIAGITTAFAGAGFVLPRAGTLAVSMSHMGYGEMRVTTVTDPDGTGENFTANDYAFSLSYGRSLAEWFSFGLSGKYITSQIWHNRASAMAVDLGVLIHTHFFSFTGQRDDGLTIGMSISNYGTRMKYDGIDLINPIDILPDREGNFADAPGQFRPSSWELPLIFRFGVALKPVSTSAQQIIVALDALHTNNNSESVNLGVQYQYQFPAFGAIYLRGGYKALFMEDSQFGLSLGGGLHLRFVNELPIRLDYAYRDMGVLGSVQSYSIGVQF